MDKPDKDKLAKLTPEQYNVCILKGTEVPFSGKYNDHKEAGVYTCVVCENKLFRSTDKFDSGSGWPSYLQPYDESAIIEQLDQSHGMQRVEVLCKKCGAHLGHVFPDGPPPTHLRFCINSTALSFIKDDAK